MILILCLCTLHCGPSGPTQLPTSTAPTWPNFETLHIINCNLENQFQSKMFLLECKFKLYLTPWCSTKSVRHLKNTVFRAGSEIKATEHLFKKTKRGQVLTKMPCKKHFKIFPQKLFHASFPYFYFYSCKLVFFPNKLAETVWCLVYISRPTVNHLIINFDFGTSLHDKCRLRR